MWDFFPQNGLILSEAFLYMEKSKNHEKTYHNRPKKFTFLRRFDGKKHGFWNIEQSIEKLVFK